ncbi:MAG: hypothetical protein O7C67_00350 [Gammaproteobacteria bacterium]|nr:hypothetical protein [Gammaproteobacteria bacterium]
MKFLCELILICTLGAADAKPIDELTYGTVLYEYYQQQYAAAMLTTLVAEEQGRLGDNPIRFELAKGSFAFADAMYDYARETFEGVPEEELTDLDRMRLAFHLAREYQRREEWQRLGEQLERIDLGKTWLGREKFHPEVEYMRADLAVQRLDFTAAQTALRKLTPNDPLRAYGLFNLGVAYKSSGDLQSARKAFSELAGMQADSDETDDLAQRARLALAFIARQQDDPIEAASLLAALPATGRYRDIAMASYGGLAMDNEDYQLAARIWLTLQNQDYWTTSTATARLGFPVSLENLASRDMALTQYKNAEASFEARLASLNALSRQSEDPAWVRGILKVFSAPERDAGQMSIVMQKWQEQLGHTDWLEWLSTERVHKVFMQWRELEGMDVWLGHLPATIAAFEELSQEQRRRGAAARSLLVDNALLSNRDVLIERSSDIANRLRALDAQQSSPDQAWMLMLANDEEAELILKFAEMRAKVERMQATDQVKWLQRIDRLNGVLFWTLVIERSDRIRAMQRKLNDNNLLLQDVDQRIARVQGAEQRFVAGVATDFLSFVDRANAISAQVRTARDRRQLMLAQEIKAGMQREMRQVEQYLLVTRIGIARAADQLAMAGDLP